jgi:hypothetical protein
MSVIYSFPSETSIVKILVCSQKVKVVAALQAIVATIVVAASIPAAAAPAEPNRFVGPRSTTIPVNNWAVDKGAFKATPTGDKSKAGTDLVTIFRPIPACRLVDTRGNGAPIQGGAITTNTTRTMTVAGKCGITTTGVVTGLSLSFHAYNGNTALPSVIAMMPVGASNAGSMVGFHSGPMNWFMSAANIKTSSDGSFNVFVGGGATIDLVVDVNGYYQDMNDLDIADQELDILANGTGQAMEISQTGTGDALQLNSSGGGSALVIGSGKISIAGSTTANSSNQAAFIHSTTSATICGTSFSIMKHTMLDNNPDAFILITPRFVTGSGAGHSTTNVPTVEYYVGACNATSASTGHWYIRAGTAGFIASTKFNVLIVTP